MTKQYNLKVSVQTAKPRSRRLRLSGGTARSEVSSAGIYESGLDLSRYLEKEIFDDLFEKIQVNGQWVIRAKYGLYSNQFISALGMVQGNLGGGSGTGGGSLFGLMRSWPSVDPGPSTQEALGANLGWELRNRIAALETAGFATQNWVLNKNYLTTHQDISHLLSKTEAASLYQPKGNYLTAHQSLSHLLSKTEAASMYQPKGNYALASALENYYTKTEINTKITALNTAIGTKLDKSVFDDLFEKIQVGGQWVIRAKYGFYSNQFISALGMVQGNLGGGSGIGGGSLFGLMRSWPSVDPGPSTQEALGANLGWELRNRIAALETAGFATQNWVLNKNYLTTHQDISHLLSKTEAASLYQPKGNYLTAHQSLSHLLSKTEAASMYQPKGNYALASALGNYYTKTEIDTKITALNTAIGTKLDKSVFDDLFEKIQVGGQWVIRAKYGFYSNQFISALGMVQGDLGGGTGTGGSLFGLMRSWPSVDPGPSTQEALGANLGWELRNRIAALETAGFATQNWVLNKNYLTTHQDISHLLSKTEAASLYQPKGNYLTSHQSLSHLLSKTEAASLYQPKGNYALASALENYYTKTEINTKLTDGSVTKVGTATVGASNWPIYLNNGVPYACAWKFGNYNGAAAVNNGILNENLNADMLDGHHKNEFNAVARFGTTAMPTSGYYKVKIKSATSWMLGFKILAYQNYCFDEINISGYNYGNSHWYLPSATLVNSQGNNKKSSIAVTFGYDSAWNLWVAIPAAYYAGISVTDVVNGYNQVADPHSLFEIVYEDTLTGTVQDTHTATCHALLTDNVASASRLQTTGTYTAWGQTYFANGVPQSVSGNLTGVGIIKFSAGNEIAFANSRFCFGTTNQAAAQGVNVGSLLVSNAWADYTKVPVNGIYIKGALRIGDILIEEDVANGGLKISGGVYATQYVSAFGLATGNLSGGSSGGGTAYDRLDAWADYTTDKAGYVLSAGLGADLNSRVGANATSINSILSRLNSLEGGGTTSVTVTGSGNAITDISKGGTAIIATKGATFLTQHQRLDYIKVKDIRGTAPKPNGYESNRVTAWFNNSDKPVAGLSEWYSGINVVGWSSLNYASWQLAAAATTHLSDNNLYFRVGLGASWEAWQKILTSANYASVLGSVYQAKGDYLTHHYINSGTIDANITIGPGEYQIRGGATLNNFPTTEVGTLLSFPSEYNRANQLYMGYGNAGLWFRGAGFSGGYGAWQKVLTDANYSSVLNGKYVTLDTAQPISGAKTFDGGLLMPYSAGTWISMAKRANQILGSVPTAGASAHSLFTLLNSTGAAISYGGLGVNIGFYGFYKARMDSGANSYDWATTWNLNTGRLTHSGDMVAHSFIKNGGTSSQFLMADGSTVSKVSASDVSHTGWGGIATDDLRIPTMTFLALWNGAYNTNGASNLQYCYQGRFGDIVTQSLSGLDSRYVKKAGDTMTGILDIVTNGASLKLGAQNAAWMHIYSTLPIAFNCNLTNAGKQDSTLGIPDCRWANVYATTINVTSTGLVSNLNADMLDGLHSTRFGRAFNDSNIDANDYNSLNGLWGGKLYNATNVPYSYYAFLHFGWGKYYGQFNAYNNQLQFRAGSESNGGPAWKTVAFTDSNVASATKLQTARTLWGQSFDGSANVSGNLTGVGFIKFSAGNEIAFANSRFCFGATNQTAAQGVNVGSLLVSNAWADSTKVPVNGAYVKGQLWCGSLRIGDAIFTYDAAHNGIKLDKGLYSEGYLSALGLSELTNTKFTISAGYESDALTILGGGITRSGYSGDVWNKGYGALNVAIDTSAGDSKQTPLLLAFSAGATDVGVASSRLFALELLNNGNTLDFKLAGEVKLSINKIGLSAWSATLNYINATSIGTATVTATGKITCQSLTQTSDMRLKNVVRPMDLSVEAIAKAPSFIHQWKRDGTFDLGSSAQYWREISPLFTPRDKNGFLTMQYGKAALLSTIAIARRTVSHEERIRTLESENKKLRAELNGLKARLRA